LGGVPGGCPIFADPKKLEKKRKEYTPLVVMIQPA
jgi:hypothetical protein